MLENYNTINIYLLTVLLAVFPLLWIYFKNSIIKWSIIFYKTVPRDLWGLSCLLRYKYRLRRFKKANGTIAGLFFSRTLRKWPNDIAFIFEDQSWTYTQVGDYANAVALYFYDNVVLLNNHNNNNDKCGNRNNCNTINNDDGLPFSTNNNDQNDETRTNKETGEKIIDHEDNFNGSPGSSVNANIPGKDIVSHLADHNAALNLQGDGVDDDLSSNFEDDELKSAETSDPTKGAFNDLPTKRQPSTEPPSHILFNGSSNKQPPIILALFMESRPEFVCYWLGLSRIGIKCALLNNQLRGEALLNSLKALPAIKGIIYGSELQEAIDELKPHLASYNGNNIKLYKVGYVIKHPNNSLSQQTPSKDYSNKLDAPTAKDSSSEQANNNTKSLDNDFIDTHFKFGQDLPPLAIYKAKSRHEILFYIYTSGTTGMPKAAIVSHVKYLYLTYLVSRTLQIRKDDVIYTALPLYHTAGGIVGVGQSIILGSTVVIKKKFSASSFWKDCIKYNCTVAQYIGEICRYLLARPPNPTEDKAHKVRLIYGNGLRKEIWKEFVDRFGIEQVGEFYGATESNANMVNIDNTFGSVGFNSVIVPRLLPITLIKVDPDSGEPLRNPKNGLCIPCKPGEQGELVGKIIKSDPVKSFQGYSDRSATKKKIVKNVFNEGDSAFLTGDMLVQDELGYYFFVDRTGDTFRWKGENVSTLEIENLMGNVLGNEYKDVVVYGVPVPGSDGKAGMASVIDTDGRLSQHFEKDPGELKRIFDELSKVLPGYAKPVFIRLTKSIDLTSTFKPKKNLLVKDGFDPNVIEPKGDHLYYLNANDKTYSPLTLEIYKSITDGNFRL